jgi:hypothetical protein
MEPVSDHYLNLRIDLAKITQRAIDLLYSPSAVVKPWASVEANIEVLEHNLQQWRLQIPATYNFSDAQSVANRYGRATQTLGLYYYMTEILITRPCLCGSDRAMKRANEALDSSMQWRDIA